MFSPGKVRDESPAEAAKHAASQQPDEASLAGDTQKTETSAPDTQPQAGQKQGIYYKCTFSKNVLVNTPEQLVFAGDKLWIIDRGDIPLQEVDLGVHRLWFRWEDDLLFVVEGHFANYGFNFQRYQVF